MAVAAVIPAYDESARVAATVTAALTVEGVDLVVVVDDGSTDDTAVRAEAAGAHVVRHHRNRGKSAAMSSGAAAVAAVELHGATPLGGPRPLLFVDADLESSAANLAPLVTPVLAGEADLTIALLPPQSAVGGGRGRVVRMAQRGITELTGWTPTQPLSGMRCITRAAFGTAVPLAGGWGVEVGLTVDVLSAGLVVREVPCELQHRVTGADWAGRLHRGRQYRDVALALARRGYLRG